MRERLWVNWQRHGRWPPRRWQPVGSLDLGSLRSVRPVSKAFGLERGLAIDRHYIEQFLDSHSADIHGVVLEIGADLYASRFGGERVGRVEVLHAAPGNPSATIVGDLTDAREIPDESLDCMILTQTLQCIFDSRAAIATLHRVLRPGGTALLTFPGISHISRYDMNRWGDYWRFTSLSARRLFEEAFGSEGVEVTVYGNVLTAIAFLHGLATEELAENELAFHDPDYELLIGVRATKSMAVP
jgi:SAM-dependent methyltransferase